MPAVVHAFPWLNNNPFRLHTELWSIEIKGCTNNVATHFIGLKDYVLDFVNGFQEYSCVE
jgi:hypothetical protein